MTPKHYRKRQKKRRESRRPGTPNSDNAREWQTYSEKLERKLEQTLRLLKKKVDRGEQEKQFYTEQLDQARDRLRELDEWPLKETPCDDSSN